MKNRLLALLLISAVMLCLCGCGHMFDKEYVSISDYLIQTGGDMPNDGKVTVKTLAGLRQAILDLAYQGKESGVIVFNQDYAGNTTEDMASACWQVRTQDALCAYCVENIAYEINKIVTIKEATVYISYSKHADKPQDIVHLSYSYAMESLLQKTIEAGERHITLLISRSSYEDGGQIESLVSKICRTNPYLAPKEPIVSVNMFSGTGLQRLYEVNINYLMNDEELAGRRKQLEELDPFKELDLKKMTEAEKAVSAVEYLMSNCTVIADTSSNTAYSALLEHSADSEGLSLAFVELCHRLGLEAQTISGQRNWTDHCWSLVKIDGMYYHVDIAGAIESGVEYTVLRDDESFWGDYRWDIASYPKCSGPLSFQTVKAQTEQR